MQADQAAGLRSHSARRGVPQVISLLSTPQEWALRLAQALHAHHAKVLLVDAAGRHALARKTQFIFGWEQQVTRQQLQTIAIQGIDVLHASGAQAGDATVVQTAAAYDFVIFDGQTLQAELLVDTRTPQTLIVGLNAQSEIRCNTYALIKTLHDKQLAWRVILLGEPTPAERIISAVGYFLPAAVPTLELVNIETDAHLLALAARISAAEMGASPFYTNTRGECAQHG